METEKLDYKVLANRIMEHGIGSESYGYYSPVANRGPLPQKGAYSRDPPWFESSCMLPEPFCKDPRVALGLMDLVRKSGTQPEFGTYKWLAMMRVVRATPLDADLSLAIVLAAMGVLDGENSG